MRALGLLLFASGIAQARPIVVVAAGDLQPGGAERDRLVEVAPLFVGELRFVNLEGPLTSRGHEVGLDAEGRPVAGAQVRFSAPPERATQLAGRIDVVSLANNHALDQGVTGRDDTARALAKVGIAAAWPGHDATLERNGQRLIVIARDFPPAANLDGQQELIEAVRRARKRGLVLVSLHWGHTGSLLPTAAERRLAARLVDAGAVAVLGHGPHAPQGIERRSGAIIAYSLGNLAFGCRCTDATDAYVLRFTIDDLGRATSVRLRPIEAGIEEPAHLSRDPGLYQLLTNLSRDLGTTLRRDGDELVSD